ncbi:MAG TPA: peptidase M22 [Clostridia bacterium]|nr:peptidase M22 [Clostridia bacterium]
MHGYLGIDTSNYTTSCAIYRAGGVVQQKRLLPVPQGQVGLRQSDAVFSHVKALGELITSLRQQDDAQLAAIGVSRRPRDIEGSYMPCFLTGLMAAETAAAVCGVPLFTFSHQAGHVAAALYGADRLDLINRSFLAFHLSGGTTECLWVKSLCDADITLLHCTNDLNAGQVVDRVGHLLGLHFPAGPALDALAQKSNRSFKIKPAFQGGNPCLSGIENQCQTMLAKGEPPADIARFCLMSILGALLKMTENAKAATGCTELVFAGGVMSNTLIRAEVETRYDGIFAPPAFSCDNAAGISVLTALRAGELVTLTSGEGAKV